MIFCVKQRIILSTILFTAVLFLSSCVVSHIFPYYMGSYRGRVIEIDTGEPIEGAVVIVIYSSSSSSIAGMLSKQIDAQETLTNANGEFVLPKVAVTGTETSGYPQGRMKIFKPGYGTLSHPSSKWYCPDDKPPRVIKRSVERDKYIIYQLPKLKTIEERRKNVPSVPSSYNFRKKKLIKYMKAIDEERIAIGFEPYTLPNVKEKQRAE